MSIINVIKMFGAVLVVIGGAVSAYILNSKAKRTLGCAEGLISLLRYVKNKVSCYAMPIERILSGCEEEVLLECGYTGERKPKSLEEFMSGCPGLDGRALKIMTEFTQNFGKNYRAEQIKLCESSIDELSALRAEISDKLPIKKKLNSTLCISGAVAIVILLA